MIVAHQKRKEDIVAYLLYMWQIEDMIRACRFDIETLRLTVIDRYDQPDDVKQQIARWYEELIDMMRSENVMQQGHIQINRNVMAQLAELHLRLQRDPKETRYGALYYRALPHIVQLRAKAGGVEMSELETCFTALYGYLMLQLRRQEVHPETVEAVGQIGEMLTFLAKRFREEEAARS